jgi:hypothetical protein
MNTHRLLTAVIVALLVGMSGGLLWGAPPAGTPSLVIPIAGTVDPPADTEGGLQERVALAGHARLTSRLALDPTFNGPPSVILTIDILNAQGKGLDTNKVYRAAGTDQVYRTRLLVSSDQVEITFAFFLAAGGPPDSIDTSPPYALASFNLSFDTQTGAILAASGKIDTPNFSQ